MPSFGKIFSLGLAARAVTGPLKESAAPAYASSTCMYTVPGLGAFTSKLDLDWSDGTLFDTALGTLTDVQSLVNGLVASTYTVAPNFAPFARRFDAANLDYEYTNTGLLGLFRKTTAITLSVPGGQKTGPISSSQITSSYSDILYGSVRTIAKTSNIPGTTHGFSFYSNDTQEIDFAFVTTDISKLHYTNEPLSQKSPVTSYTGDAPDDAATAYHEYRVDWAPNWSAFYVDSVLQQNITQNVPSVPGFWVWNNWSNGNSWSLGPPAKTNTLSIRSITAYWNRTSITRQMPGRKNGACNL